MKLKNGGELIARCFGRFNGTLWDDVFAEIGPLNERDVIIVNFGAWYPRFNYHEIRVSSPAFIFLTTSDLPVLVLGSASVECNCTLCIIITTNTPMHDRGKEPKKSRIWTVVSFLWSQALILKVLCAQTPFEAFKLDVKEIFMEKLAKSPAHTFWRINSPSHFGGHTGTFTAIQEMLVRLFPRMKLCCTGSQRLQAGNTFLLLASYRRETVFQIQWRSVRHACAFMCAQAPHSSSLLG